MSDQRKAKFKDRLAEALAKRDIKAIDLATALNIPKSTISYYLSGRNEAKSDRVYQIAKHLDVNEAWLMGYDVPMQRDERQKKNDQLVELVVRLRSDEKFARSVAMLAELTPTQYATIDQLLVEFTKK